MGLVLDAPVMEAPLKEKIALLFPGQGSQFVGMGKNLFEEFPEARDVFQKADALLSDLKLTNLCFNGPEEILKLTLFAQPAIFTVSMASYEVFKRLGKSVSYAAGHSVGEYAALAASGVFSFESGLRLVRKRGELMYEAGQRKPGTMAALLGLDEAAAESVCNAASTKENIVEVANLNTPAQIVISGSPLGVEKACLLAKERGAKRVVPLQVSGAFHSALMEEAAERLAHELDQTEFHVEKFPVVANLTAKPASDTTEIRTLLKKQIRKKVLWTQTIRFLLSEGVTLFVEMQPGAVLSGLVRSIDKKAQTTTLEQFLQATVRQ